MTLSQPDEGYHQDASERQDDEIVVPKEEVTMTKTHKVIYYRRSRGGGRFYNWTRKVQKRATPLKRMWKSEKVEEAAEECQPLIIGEPLLAEAALVLNPMDYVSNLSDANAMHRMAG